MIFFVYKLCEYWIDLVVSDYKFYLLVVLYFFDMLGDNIFVIVMVELFDGFVFEVCGLVFNVWLWFGDLVFDVGFEF